MCDVRALDSGHRSSQGPRLKTTIASNVFASTARELRAFIDYDSQIRFEFGPVVVVAHRGQISKLC